MLTKSQNRRLVALPSPTVIHQPSIYPNRNHPSSVYATTPTHNIPTSSASPPQHLRQGTHCFLFSLVFTLLSVALQTRVVTGKHARLATVCRRKKRDPKDQGTERQKEAVRGTDQLIVTATYAAHANSPVRFRACLGRVSYRRTVSFPPSLRRPTFPSSILGSNTIRTASHPIGRIEETQSLDGEQSHCRASRRGGLQRWWRWWRWRRWGYNSFNFVDAHKGSYPPIT